MTEKEFYEALSNLKYVPLFGACNRIRFTSGKKNALLDLCPITAVLMSETGEFLHSHKYLQAANKLGLEEEFAEEVEMVPWFVSTVLSMAFCKVG